MIEITTIGAGGGSIAWVDRGGILQIGPESAGSDLVPYAMASGMTAHRDRRQSCSGPNKWRNIGGALERLDMNAAKCA